MRLRVQHVANLLNNSDLNHFQEFLEIFYQRPDKSKASHYQFHSLINAETSDLHPIVMCTSKSENVHPFFSIIHRSHRDTSLLTKLQGENTDVLS